MIERKTTMVRTNKREERKKGRKGNGGRRRVKNRERYIQYNGGKKVAYVSTSILPPTPAVLEASICINTSFFSIVLAIKPLSAAHGFIAG